MSSGVSIVIHGGVGSSEDVSDGCRAAADRGYEIISKGGTALDAVCEAVVILENDDRYNAGTGSRMKLNGEVEMDAAVMTSDGLCGAVAGIKYVKNPILIARKVMEITPHVLLTGDNATLFARKCGFEYHNPATEKARKRLDESIKKLQSEKDPKYEWILQNYPELFHGTVGAVARDSKGIFACSVSTGGTEIGLPGRVGDSAIIGAGIYAGPKGSICATGNGEEIIRRVLSKTVYDDFEKIKSLQENLQSKVSVFPKNLSVGLIAISENDHGIAATKSMASAIK